MTSKLLRTTSALALTAFSLTALCAAAPGVRAEPGDTLRIAQKAEGGDGQNVDAENPNADGKQKGEGRRRDDNRPERQERQELPERGEPPERGERPQRVERGDRGNGDNRGGDSRANTKNENEPGNAPTKTLDRPDGVKPNTPKIINSPDAVETRDPPPLKQPVTKPDVRPVVKPDVQQITKPDVRPDVSPVLKPDARPVVKPVAPPVDQPRIRETAKPPAVTPPPVTTAVPPPSEIIKKEPPAVVPVDTQRRDRDRRRDVENNTRRAPGNAPFDANARDPRNPDPVTAVPTKPRVRDLDEAKSGRIERREDGGNRTVFVEKDKRQIVRQGNRIVIQKDESAQLRRMSPDAVVTRDKRGRDRTVVQRRDNTEVVTETDRSGQLLRRYRRDRDGRETVIIDNRRRGKDKFGRNVAIGLGVGAGIIAGAAILNSVVDVPPPRVRVPRDKYIVDYERASEDEVYEALNAPPVDDIEHGYTLDQVRATPRLRERMRRVDLDDITFETGSWDINPSQYRKLERIARAMQRVIDRNPNEVFLIEGYTDAVGSDVDNLTLSDRRAEAVSVVLTEEFEVPFENLTTQGYGEEYLKIPTDGPERANRRVAARRITPLLNRDLSSAPPRPPEPDRGYDDRDGRYDAPGDRRWRRFN